MFFKLFCLFTLVSLLELALIIEVGSHVGVLTTILLILGTAVLGAHLAQTQGLQILTHLRAELQAGQMPDNTLIEGLLILAGGLLLLTPGFLTDTLGFLLIIPPSRKWFREKLKNYFRRRMNLKIHYWHM
ncbi:MAG: FxsA family protein [Candidatus Desulfofervidaceae bacterium]|nr:FxsA family protein [Candidatus Desulfofervidaceae bacterium]MDL1971223.1 FxsA family protein [Candidatus Desulfofervidaceae bacterium]